jgi:hypothetical protein
VQWSLDALVASGNLECDEADEQFQDCDWPAAPLGSYALTDWGDATLAVLSERTFEHAVELGMQAYEKTGDVRAAIVEAAVQARHLPGPLAPAGREVSLLHHSSAWSTRSGSSDVTRLARGLRSVRPVSRRRPV